MSLLRRRDVRERALVVVVRCGVLGAALALAGCASDAEQRREAYAQAHAMRATPPARQPAQELEDDGLPPQVPPPANRKREPDDPREPFSPNYGRPAAPPQRAALVAPTRTEPSRRVAAF